jgi:hypothetical protein
MKRKARHGTDPIECQMELALSPGAFIPDRASFSFVSDLEGVAAVVGKLARAEPVRAATLYETFLTGCYEKAEELHDSSGSFGLFVGDLICAWIKARQASGAGPDETDAPFLCQAVRPVSPLTGDCRSAADENNSGGSNDAEESCRTPIFSGIRSTRAEDK